MWKQSFILLFKLNTASARWAVKDLTVDQRATLTTEFVEHNKEGADFLEKTETSNETWAHHFMSE